LTLAFLKGTTMNLSALSAEEMIAHTQVWLTEPAQSLIAANAVLSTGFLAVKLAATALTATQAKYGDASAPQRALSEEAAVCDARHDARIRGTAQFLEALARLREEPIYLDYLAFLLPDGPGAVSASYDAEVGAAELLAARLDQDAAMKKAIKALSVDGKSLLTFVEGWIADARRIGEIMREKAALAATEEGPAPAVLRSLRNDWAKKARAFHASAALAGLDEATHTAIFGRLEAIKKASRAKKAPEGDTPA
jgi:hypothetical protein